MPKKITKPAALALIVSIALSVGACTESRLRLSDDLGRAVRQDLVAQVADPDPAYKGRPAPGASGPRVALAQDRYVTGTVIRPASTSTSSVTMEGGGSGGGSGSSGQ